jgi:hypothetical protein
MYRKPNTSYEDPRLQTDSLVEICKRAKHIGKLRDNILLPSNEDNHSSKIQKTVRVFEEYLDRQQTTCVICLDDMYKTGSDVLLRVLPCGHILHHFCLLKCVGFRGN